MAFERGPVIQRAGTAARADIDEGLRAFMLKIYNYMSLALGVTGAVAMFTASSDTMMQAIFGTPLAYVVMFSPLAFILVLSFGINKLSTGAVQAIFWAFAATMGLSMASIFMVYTDTSIAKVFFITASVFAAMSLYGYTTKRSLAAMGAFMFMGLIGIVIAMVVNLFMQSSGLEFAISILGVLIFTGLTAWDTQKLKMIYIQSDGTAVTEKTAIYGALTLYLDFINLFYFLLMLLGNRD
ncbi:MAG: Bax inhibitor-1/YccA family protein [Alphaproteobacteria bacterium]